MKMKYCIFFAFLLFVNNILGIDGIEYVKGDGWIDSASVTSTNIVVKFLPNQDSFSVKQNDMRRRVLEYTENNEALQIAPDLETWFISRNSQVVFKPISFKNQYKGFRVIKMFVGDSAHGDVPVITYIVLSDSPVEMGEEDVDMVMDNGEWVNVKNSRSLEIEKLGWYAGIFMNDAEKIMQDAEIMARISRDPYFAKLWTTLVEKGLIKQSIEPSLAVMPEKDETGIIIAPRSGAILSSRVDEAETVETSSFAVAAEVAADDKQSEEPVTESIPVLEDEKPDNNDTAWCNRLCVVAVICILLIPCCAILWIMQKKRKRVRCEP